MGLNFFNVSGNKLFLKTAIESENIGIWGYFSGAEGAGNFFLSLATRYFGICLVQRRG